MGVESKRGRGMVPLMFSRSTCFKRSDKFFDIRAMKSFFLRELLHGFHRNTCERRTWWRANTVRPVPIVSFEDDSL